MHPLLQQPCWYMLHPCQTPELMRLLLINNTCQEPPSGSNEMGVPDIDDVLVDCDLQTILSGHAGAAAPLEPHLSAAPVEPHLSSARGSWPSADPSDELLLRYMEAWIRVVGPVVGLRLPVA